MKILILKTARREYDEDMLSSLISNSTENEYELNYFEKIYIEASSDYVSIKVNNKNIDEYDFVYFKSWRKKAYIASVIASYLKRKNMNFADKVISNVGISMNKIYQMVNLSLMGIKIPKSIFISEVYENTYAILKNKLGNHFIAKAVSAKEGRNNYLIKSTEEFKKNVLYEKQRLPFIFQEYIENDSDYRAGVFFNETVYLKKRIRTNPNTHLNNIAVGAIAHFLSIDDHLEIADIAKKSAKIFDLDIAGVDLVESKSSDELFVLEVNPSPSFRHNPEVLELLDKKFKN